MSTQSGQSKLIKIDQSQNGQRLDKFLVSKFPEISRAKWQKSVKNGEVIVNGKISESDRKLREGDLVEIFEQKKKEAISFKSPDIRIIYEDDDVMILDKPAGIPVHGAPSYSGPTVVDFLMNHYPGIKNVGEDKTRPGIVHRLDKDTSGVLAIAKNNRSFQFLKDQFQNRLAKKTYLALVYGDIKSSGGTIDLPIGRSKSDPKKQTVIDSEKKKHIRSKEAITIFRVIKRYDKYTLLEAEPKTGRMHQIRVHLKALGHPVVGDSKYSPKKAQKNGSELGRQFLHAMKLEITLPSGEKKVFSSEIPQDLADFLRNSEQNI